MESVIPEIPGVRAHHAVLRNGRFDFASNRRVIGENLFNSEAAAEAARQSKAKIFQGKKGGETYLAETEVVFLNDGQAVLVVNQQMTHQGNTLV